jgi:hypothetical protein
MRTGAAAADAVTSTAARAKRRIWHEIICRSDRSLAAPVIYCAVIGDSTFVLVTDGGDQRPVRASSRGA